MSLTSALRKFVDWDFGSSAAVGGNASILIAMLPWILPITFRDSHDPRLRIGSLILAAALSGTWLIFVGWRAWLLLRSYSIKADREYDARGKFKLPPEYADKPVEKPE